MTNPALVHVGRTTLADLWDDATPTDCLVRLGYTVAWSAKASFYNVTPAEASHYNKPFSDAEDFILHRPEGDWIAIRVGKADEDDPDLFWDTAEDRAVLLQEAFLGRYAGPTNTLGDLIVDLAATTEPRTEFVADRDWGAGKTLLAALDLLDPETRAATEMLHALSHPDLIESLHKLSHYLTNMARNGWTEEAEFEFAQAAARLWPTLTTGLHVPDRRMSQDLLIYPWDEWSAHATRLLIAAGLTNGSGTYKALEALWVRKGKDRFLFCVYEVHALMPKDVQQRVPLAR